MAAAFNSGWFFSHHVPKTSGADRRDRNLCAVAALAKAARPMFSATIQTQPVCAEDQVRSASIFVLAGAAILWVAACRDDTSTSTSEGGQAGNSTAGASSGQGGADGGSPGNGTCGTVACEGLDEPTCESFPKACLSRRGAPWPQSLEAATYAGCASLCCGEECEVPTTAAVCVEDGGGACWTLPMAPAPDGWTILSDVDDCSSFDECLTE